MPKYPPHDRKRRALYFAPVAGKRQAGETFRQAKTREYKITGRQPGAGKRQKTRRDGGKHRQNPRK